MQRRFQQVDVFTDKPYLGNPVAVVLHGEGLASEQMQAIARWTNLSETTFVCRPDDSRADYRLRIFTPASELPFAGHPTIGSAHALLASGFAPKQPGILLQECGVGLVELRTDNGIRLALPPARLSPVGQDMRTMLEEAVGTELKNPPLTIDLGPKWLTAQVKSGDLLRRLRPNMNRLAALSLRLGITGVNLFGLDDDVAEVRSFAPHEGVPEDPVCGSGNGAVAYYLREHRGAVDYAARQGRCIGRDGHIRITYGSDGRIWLGGHAVTCIEGTISA